MSDKLSNVIGAPFSDYVLTQLYLRAQKNSTTNRTNDEVLFLANKGAWARLVSSVNIVSPTSPTVEAINQPQYFTAASEFSSVFSSPAFQSSVLNNNIVSNPNNSPKSLTTVQNFYKGLGLNTSIYQNEADLAKNWVLEAGTSIQTGNGITLRQGVGLEGAYGLGGTEELGYRPMPGLTSVQIETTGRLGSLRQAVVNFKVWNMDQLNIIEALYFRLGYSMLLEWGHTQYYQNKQPNILQTDGIYGISDPFGQNLRKEAIQQAISKKAKDTSGNYDGMLGIVSNFTWAFNQDGGYDCTVKLVGLGAVMDSMRINQAYKLPDGLVAEYKKNKEAVNAGVQAQINAIKKQVDDLAKQQTGNLPPNLPLEAPKDIQQLYEYAKRKDIDNNQDSYGQFTSSYQAYPAQQIGFGRTAIPDYYYTSIASRKEERDKFDEHYFGLQLAANNTFFRARLNKNTVFTLNNKLVDDSAKDAVDNLAVGFLGDTLQVDPYYKVPNNLQTKAAYSWLGKNFYVQSGQVNQYNPTSVALDQEYNKGTVRFTYTHLVGPTTNDSQEKIFETIISFTNSKSDEFSVTRQQVVDAFDAWYTSPNAQLTVNEISLSSPVLSSYKSIVVEATAQVTIPNVKPSSKVGFTSDLSIPFHFKFNNTSYINQVLGSATSDAAIPQQAQIKATGDNGGVINQSTTDQTTAAEGFASALEAMLTVIQAKGQADAREEKVFKAVNIFQDTKLFYKDGTLNEVLTTSKTASTTFAGIGGVVGATTATGTATTTSDSVPFDLVKYAQKGFNSNLMVDPTLFNLIPYVNFNDLCYAYTLKYTQTAPDGSSDKVRSPVYIQLGYLLAFLNNMCLIYDSTENVTDVTKIDGKQKRPYVYIDFNPETNFCLTSPQQFSVDPLICLVPCNATQAQFKSIFPPSVNTSIFAPPLFDPTKTNDVSQRLNKANVNFKSSDNPFQGRTMNILLNTQYLLNTVQSYAGSDATHAVNLQTFLERIMVDVNKSMGNLNSFRIAYRDDTNTIQIQDDQWVPNLSNEASMMSRDAYKSSLQTNKAVSGLLPIFNTAGNTGGTPTLSMVRQFQLKTTLSTKLGSMIAISAQSNTTSVNATDHSELSYLNQYYQDRYKPWIQDPSNGASGNDTTTSGSNDQKLGELFNAHMHSIYQEVDTFDMSKIETAKNYYIERISKVKSGDPITTATPFIPANLEMTIDGISGIIMGNAFTIPENRLPLSLRGDDGFTKVGFIVVGLNHTINNNEWLTQIRGQMIKLRESTAYGITQQITSVQTSVQPTGFNNTVATVPWSAAFISYVINQAGVRFPSNAAHTGYAQTLRTNISYGFQVLDPKGTTLQPGDIVIRNRNGNSLAFYSNPWTGDSHGDIVVSINGNSAVVIGGNVSNKVASTNLTLSNGTLGSPNYFVILRPPQISTSNIVNAANTEYKLWKLNNWTEQTPAAHATLVAYYKIVGITI